MKYQFCIRFTNIDINSAASKAVTDCKVIFSKNGYIDYTFTVVDNAKKVRYYFMLLKELVSFYFSIKKKSIVVVQYPLLSINNIFKYFIKLAKVKKAKFYCVIHDLESLRAGGKDQEYIAREISNLNYFDCVIAHNPFMIEWLQVHSLKAKVVSLNVFDYLTNSVSVEKPRIFDRTIVFAGNLSKSTFIYNLDIIKAWKFNLYGPNYIKPVNSFSNNSKWLGEYSPENVVYKLDGNFGLIWDGDNVEKSDDILGNYLKYNNPHKFSLYIAAGLPVIAPSNSAISHFIKFHNIGLLIDNLLDLDDLPVNEYAYEIMKNNVLKIKEKVVKGEYLTSALALAESELHQTT